MDWIAFGDAHECRRSSRSSASKKVRVDRRWAGRCWRCTLLRNGVRPLPAYRVTETGARKSTRLLDASRRRSHDMGTVDRKSARHMRGITSSPEAPVDLSAACSGDRGSTVTAIAGWSDETLLENLARAAFEYFPLNTHPDNGLVADTSREHSPCSIAVVGFAFTVWSVAAARGWVERPEAVR